MDSKTEQIFIIDTSEAQSVIEPHHSSETTTAQPNLQNVLTGNVCRTCAAATEFLIPIFHGEGLQNNLAEKIHKHLPIQVSEQDELPVVVCYQCASTLLAWHELVECCVQADQALRTRLAVHNAAKQQESQPGTSAANSDALTQQQDSDKDKNKFGSKCALELVPPQYSEVTAIPCPYCGLVLSDRGSHTEHLVAAHAELLFHCDECDQYVDRKDLILHMTVHAVQYSLDDKRALAAAPSAHHAGLPDTKPAIKKRSDEPPEDELTPVKTETPPNKNETEFKTEAPRHSNTSREASEFSEHTDTEDGFGPLPESVFEAIEDSQDSQPPPSEPPRPKQKKSKKWARACPYCPKVYTASSSYFYHIRYSHKGIKEHECDVCKRKFATKASVKQHMATHDLAAPHECTDCGKRFRSTASLYIHRQTHAAVKRFVCVTCGKGFRWKQLLARHEQRHGATRTHECGECGRGFRVRCDLLRHARTHSAGAHACARCGRHFAQLRYLKVHMDKKHSATSISDAVDPGGLC